MRVYGVHTLVQTATYSLATLLIRALVISRLTKAVGSKKRMAPATTACNTHWNGIEKAPPSIRGNIMPIPHFKSEMPSRKTINRRLVVAPVAPMYYFIESGTALGSGFLLFYCGEMVPARSQSLNQRRTSTVADILEMNGGTGPGFNALRLLLSVWVFTAHAMFICAGAEAAEAFAADPIHGLLIKPALPMFFIVSGYLVAGSAIRTESVSIFLLFRVLRIAPALTVEIALSALILGPWLTEKTLPEYFSDPLFMRYFLNIVGDVQFFLPGLFIRNPVPGTVNLNLWTLRPEFFCYLFISAMIASKFISNRKLCTLVALLAIFSTVVYAFRGGQLYNFAAVADWKILVASFVIGCCAFHWNDRLVMSGGRAMLAILVAVGAMMYSPLIVLNLLALTYIVIYIGTRKICLPSVLRDGDYSYGIYLFGFPIQQTLVYFLPSEYRSGLVVLLLGLPLTVAFAVFSWNFVEKPASKLKTRIRGRSSVDSGVGQRLAAL